jgi:hypothetical protein
MDAKGRPLGLCGAIKMLSTREALSREPRAESKEQRAESREQRAESREQRENDCVVALG